MTENASNGTRHNLYDKFTDDEGRSSNYPHLEPNPERWAVVLHHSRFHRSLTQLDDLMRDYDHVAELHVGEESFRDLNHREKRLPSQLNFYIAEDRQDFLREINHPVFREMGTDEFSVPKGTDIGLAFGERAYRDVINVPENFDYLDVKVPTFFAHTRRDLEKVDLEALDI